MVLILALSLVLTACGALGLGSLLPIISSITPLSVIAGGAAFTLTVNGQNFQSAVVEINGKPVQTTSGTSTQLIALVPQSLFQNPGTLIVTVVNLLPSGNQTSNQTTITVQNGTPTPVLTITKTHSGNFTQGQIGAIFTVTAGNSGTASSSGTVTVTEAPPAGLSVTALSGSGWTCVVTSLTCTRSDALPADSSYPIITVTVSVASSAPATVTNTVTVSGGGSTTATGGDTVTVTPPPTPVLKITKTHTGNFTQGQTGATFTITVSNTGTGPSNGTVTATEIPPGSLTIAALSGTGWTCTITLGTCTRSDALPAGNSYPTITVTVTVSASAPASITNTVSISGGGSTTGSGSDTVTVVPPGTASLTITKTHVGNFTQGGTGSYTITVKNVGSASTSGTVTVADTVPSGLTAATLSGTGWTCSIGVTVGCNRSDALAAGASYPAITLTVSVSSSAPGTVTNTVTVSGGGSSIATASDPTTINPSSGGTPVFTITGFGPGSATYNNNVTIKVTVKNTGTGSTSGTVTVQFSSASGLFSPISVGGDPWSCDQIALSCTRSDVLAPGQSYPSIGLIYEIGTGAPSPLTVTATVSGGGTTSSASVNIATPVIACSPAPGTLCGQYALFVQGYTSAGPRAVAASFTADGAGHITAGMLDVNSMASPHTAVPILTTSPTAYNFESNNFGNVIFNTSAGVFVFKFIQRNFGLSADVIEFEPSGNAGGSGFMVQQNPTFIAASVTGNYALGLLGGPGGASAGVRLGMIGAIDANGTCGFGSTGATGTINDGGAVSTAVGFSGTLDPASCTVDPTTGRGTGTFSSVAGSPSLGFSTVNFAFYIISADPNGLATAMVLLSTDQTTASQPLLSGAVTGQANAPYSTNAAIDCGVPGNPSASKGCVFSTSGATGGNSLTGDGHVSGGIATVTTQSNTAGSVSFLNDDNKGGVITSGTIAGTYSYVADGNGVITPASGEPLAFVLTGTDSGIMLGTGGSVAMGSFVPQTATNLSTSSAAKFIASTTFEGTTAVANTLVNSTFTPNSPLPSSSGTISGNTRSWSSASLQLANTLAGNYATAPATGRGTGTTTSGTDIDGAASFVYYVINANTFVLIGTTTSGTGTTTPVLMNFQAP